MTIDEFYQEYCIPCGSQRCEGPGTIWGLVVLAIEKRF